MVRIIRVHDPDRQPANWSGHIRPGQFVAFAKRLDGGGSCDANGRPFGAPLDVTCLLFDTIDEANAYCTDAAGRHPSVSFEIFDHQGRSHPPLLVVVDASRASALPGNPRTIRRYQYSAAALVIAAIGLFWVDYAQEGNLLILPTVVGVNLLLTAGRLLQMSYGARDAERARRERLARLTRTEHEDNSPTPAVSKRAKPM